MPSCFKESIFENKVTVIIDCFEIFIENASHLYTGAQSWSNYKHHKTVKVLIGITPQGTISFISDAYGGRISDKAITKASGFLDKLLPYDLVLADRGFLIEEDVQSVLAEVKLPAFTKGKSQLHPKEIEETRQIAHVRIHVERIIGSLRQKFPILAGPLTITLLSTTQRSAMQLIDLYRIHLLLTIQNSGQIKSLQHDCILPHSQPCRCNVQRE
ncbi:uncharacterized protein LOC127278597 [Leptopilina boulardi]|uniref:uncharacterized protein LOC127278597 n=1 Tax=Leptopilina boulardi TaxID=63433 RepID=UPI0021F63AB3|nr:uncharacterized protein LOC127278597 [Leptopilina boulardi]